MLQKTYVGILLILLLTFICLGACGEEEIAAVTVSRNVLKSEPALA